jgi:hypothetical protein
MALTANDNAQCKTTGIHKGMHGKIFEQDEKTMPFPMQPGKPYRRQSTPHLSDQEIPAGEKKAQITCALH